MCDDDDRDEKMGKNLASNNATTEQLLIPKLDATQTHAQSPISHLAVVRRADAEVAVVAAARGASACTRAEGTTNADVEAARRHTADAKTLEKPCAIMIVLRRKRYLGNPVMRYRALRLLRVLLRIERGWLWSNVCGTFGAAATHGGDRGGGSCSHPDCCERREM